LNQKPETLNQKPLITIIPAKPFAEAKTRLAAALSADERARLSRHLLRRTIAVAKTVGAVAVVSRSAAVRRLAKSAGAWALVETGNGLNAAIRQGIAWAERRGAGAVLVLPLDLPLLTVTELREFSATGADISPYVAIAPCRHGSGTNALLLRPPVLIEPQFGVDSFSRHYTAAGQAGVTPRIFRLPGLSFDLDTPRDWHEYHTFSQNLSDNPTNLRAFDVIQKLK